MAQQTFKFCDIYGTRKDVRSIQVITQEVDDTGAVIPGSVIIYGEFDASPRARLRLSRAIHRGMTPAKNEPVPEDVDNQILIAEAPEPSRGEAT